MIDLKKSRARKRGTLTFRVTDALRSELEREAATQQCSLSELIERTLEQRMLIRLTEGTALARIADALESIVEPLAHISRVAG